MKKNEIDQRTLELIINNSKESIFVTDGDGRVILANPVACTLLGAAQEELLGKQVTELMTRG